MSSGGASAEEAAVATGRPAGLRRNLNFQILWTGAASSNLAVSTSDVAYPLTILAATESPAQAALFASVQGLAALAAGLPAGSVNDRFPPRAVLALTETCRAGIGLVTVAAALTGRLSMLLLLTAAAVIGFGQPLAHTAQLLVLRQVVPPHQLTAALMQDEVRTNGAAMAGPALGGALHGIRGLQHAVPFLFTTAAFALSALTALLVRMPRAPAYRTPTPEPTSTPDPALVPDPALAPAEVPDSAGAPEPAEAPAPAEWAARRVRADPLAGARWLWGHPVLRAATSLVMAVGTAAAGLQLAVIVTLRDQGVPAGVIGLALAIGEGGAIAGIGLVTLLRQVRPGVFLAVTCMLQIPLFALLAVPMGPWWAAGLLFVAVLGIPAIRVLMDILVIRQAPPARRGRVIAALMTLIALGAPLGSAGTGLLLQHVPVQAALLTLAGAVALGSAYGLTRGCLWRARWPP
ncbi:MFS transporter [Streptomyces tauricus]